MLTGGPGADHLDGGSGFDFVRYDTVTSGVTVDLADPSVNTGDAAGDDYVSIEGVIGSIFDDTLIGNATSSYLAGGYGNDRLTRGARARCCHRGPGHVFCCH